MPTLATSCRAYLSPASTHTNLLFGAERSAPVNTHSDVIANTRINGGAAEGNSEAARRVAGNKAVVARIYEELINQQNKQVIAECFHEDVVIHDPFTGTMCGALAFHQLLAMFDLAFPGHTVTIEGMIAEGDRVAVLHTHTAVHTGEFMGVPGTGRTAVVPGIELFRVQDGKIV
jgi:steroid delta-isomerase-like uncharacterized protein